MSEIWARRTFIWKILLGLATVATPFIIHRLTWDDKEIGTTTQINSNSSQSGLPTIRIDSVYVSQVSMDVPGVFELSIRGDQNSDIHNIQVMMDFGRAEIDHCGYAPKSSVQSIVADDRSYRRIEIDKIRPLEKFYIRCQIDPPLFEQVVVTAPDISRNISVSFDEYQASLESDSAGFWQVLGYIIAIFMAGALFIKFCSLLFPD